MIDYARLGRSIEAYKHMGYVHIEVPWTVTEAVSNVTKPEGANDFKIANKAKVLVASAEQGYLYLALKGFLPPGKYQAITPCFRDEPFDISHTKYFMKNELIVTDEVTEGALVRMVGNAMDFFVSELPNANLEMTTTPQGFDIELNGIEIGSYGIRQTSFLTWIYGTGLAEPRFTIAARAKVSRHTGYE